MPIGAVLLNVAEQHNAICLWAEVDTEAAQEPVTFEVYSTGHEMPTSQDITREYVGSAIVSGGNYVFHVYKINEGG